MFHWISSWSFLSGGDVQALITSVFFVPILSGLGAIQLAQEPDGILALAGQQKLRRKREKARLARISAAEAEVHGGAVPEHERHHRTEESADRSELAAIHGQQERSSPPTTLRSPCGAWSRATAMRKSSTASTSASTAAG